MVQLALHSPAVPLRNMLAAWARRTTTTFAELVSGFQEDQAAPVPTGGLIYRLTQWPELPQRDRTAAVYRTLSVMTNRPVNRRWIEQTSRLKGRQLDRLLEMLAAQDALQVTDPARFC